MAIIKPETHTHAEFVFPSMIHHDDDVDGHTHAKMKTHSLQDEREEGASL